jgi:tRNA A-37 threonylcarbamoyl transferase component Bud32/tetratricopeptide (TPR) repeat protein
MTDPNDEAAIVWAFLRKVAEDRSRSIERSLVDYQALYPGYDAAIEREFAALAETAPPPDATTSAVFRALGQDVDPGIDLRRARAAMPGHGDPRSDIGRYRDHGEVAQGGMGEIRDVWDPDLRRRIAMKRLHGNTPGSASADRQMLARFLEEAQVTSQLEHPGIVPVHELGIDDSGRVYFTMAMVRGQTFLEVVEAVRAGSEDWPLARALGVLQRVGDAVAFAHSRGVIHRDLKPGNIMVGRFGEVYVMDWGLARVEGREHGTDEDRSVADRAVSSVRTDGGDDGAGAMLRTMVGEVVGTASYMAPEQARGERDAIGPWTDVYALGAVLRHLLVGAPPFAERDPSTSSRAILDALADGPPPPLLELAPDLPPELVAICDKAMARERGDRYASVERFGADLRAFLELRVVRAYERGALAELRKWVLRNRGLAAAAALAVLGLGAGLVVSLIQTERAESAAQRAARAAARADDHFGLATAAMDELTELGSNSLANVPGTEDARRRLLQTALDFHLRFVALESDDAATREREAYAWGHVADIRRELGQYDRAEQAAERALHSLTELLRAQPGRLDLRASAAWTRNTLGALDLHRNRFEDAQAHLESAERELDAVLDRGFDEFRARIRRAHVVHNLGVLHAYRRDREAELAARERGVALRRELVAARPGDVGLRAHLASTLSALAGVLRRQREHDRAASLSAEAVELTEQVLRDEPRDRKHRSDAVVSWNTRGLVLKTRRETEAATTAFERALEIAQGLARDFHLVPEHHDLCGLPARNLANLMSSRRAYPEMRRHAEVAVDAQARALQLTPDSPRFQANARNAHELLLRSLSCLQDHAELARRATELPAAGLDAEAWAQHCAGYHLARSASLVVDDQSLTQDRRQTLLADYQSRSVAALQAAFDLGWRDWELRSTVYARVRRTPGFAALKQQVEGLPGGNGEPDGADK